MKSPIDMMVDAACGLDPNNPPEWVPMPATPPDVYTQALLDLANACVKLRKKQKRGKAVELDRMKVADATDKLIEQGW